MGFGYPLRPGPRYDSLATIAGVDHARLLATALDEARAACARAASRSGAAVRRDRRRARQRAQPARSAPRPVAHAEVDAFRNAGRRPFESGGSHTAAKTEASRAPTSRPRRARSGPSARAFEPGACGRRRPRWPVAHEIRSGPARGLSRSEALRYGPITLGREER